HAHILLLSTCLSFHSTSHQHNSIHSSIHSLPLSRSLSLSLFSPSRFSLLSLQFQSSFTELAKIKRFSPLGCSLQAKPALCPLQIGTKTSELKKTRTRSIKLDTYSKRSIGQTPSQH
ncbi:MAG: hypothetical protein J3R72DRAFT_481121, partial [Linnemannia gamsii]